MSCAALLGRAFSAAGFEDGPRSGVLLTHSPSSHGDCRRRACSLHFWVRLGRFWGGPHFGLAMGGTQTRAASQSLRLWRSHTSTRSRSTTTRSESDSSVNFTTGGARRRPRASGWCQGYADAPPGRYEPNNSFYYEIMSITRRGRPCVSGSAVRPLASQAISMCRSNWRHRRVGRGFTAPDSRGAG